MRANQLFRKILPYLTAAVLFAALTGIYFAPQFQGKTLVMNDIVQYQGASKDTEDHITRYGEDPQWTGTSFSGMPTSLINMRYESQLVKKLNPLLEFMGRPASLIFLAMAAFFVMLLMFGVNPWVGIVPALAYGLSTYFFIIIGAGHITKMLALAYAPLMVGATYFTLRRNMWLGAAMTALFASLEISANHPQITYYFGFVMAALWINEGIRAFKDKVLLRFAKATGLLIVAGVLAFGSNLAPLWYINEYSKDSIRGGSELSQPAEEGPANARGLDLEYVTQWSYGVGESFNMFIPNLYGGSSEGNFSDDGPVAGSLTKYGYRNLATSLPSYWGDQPVTAGPTYLGAVMIFLFVLGLFLLCPRKTVWIVVVSLLALLLSWGHNFMGFTKLFFYYFPAYDKFRTVAMILVIVEWTVPFLAALVLNKIWKGGIDPARFRRSLIWSVGITGGIALFFALFGPSLFTFSAASDSYMGLPPDVLDAMRAERKSMLRADSWRSLAFVVLSAGVLWLFMKGKLKRAWMLACLAILVSVDLVTVNARFLSRDKFVDKTRPQIAATEADRQILADPEPGFRVLNLTVSPFNDATTSYFHRSVGGYHGAKLQRYQDLIERYLSDPVSPVYNMLNTKYVITPDRETGQPFAYRNYEANGPAWFVRDVIWADDPDAEIEKLGRIDNKTEAVADRRFADALGRYVPGEDSTAYIRLTDYKPNHLTYEYDSNREAVAVFSEIYYDKGWKAFIDGSEAPYFRADYVLRAMLLPEGRHTVEFRFRADNFDKISTVTLVFSILIYVSLAAAVAAAILCNRNKRAKDAGK